MNKESAIHLSNHVAKLIGLCATYEAVNGRRSAVKPGSAAEIWNLYEAIQNLQVEIACYLDVDALNAPNEHHLHWWSHQDVMDIVVVNEIMQRVNQLIVAYAYEETNMTAHNSNHLILCTQKRIAGLLHPATRMIALDHLSQEKIAG